LVNQTTKTQEKVKIQTKAKRANKLIEFSYVDNMVYLTVETHNLETDTKTTSIEIYEGVSNTSIKVAESIYKNPKMDLYTSITSMSNKLCKTWELITDKQKDYLESTKQFDYIGKTRA